VKQNEVKKAFEFRMWLIQKYLVILPFDECPQQFYFAILRVKKKVSDVELMFNPLTPNDLYMSRTAPLTSKR